MARSVTPLALLALLLAAPAARAQTCAVSTYSYGSGVCAPCPAGAAFAAASGTCRPSASLPGPTDTALYLSGSSAEGVAAFPTIVAPEHVTFSTGVFGTPDAALALAAGGYLAVPGPHAPSTLPAGGNVAWSASAWVRCAAPATRAAVFEWGAAGDTGAAASIALNVGINAPLLNSGSAAPLYSSLSYPHSAAVDKAGVIYVTDDGNSRIVAVSPSGAATVFAGGGSSGTQRGSLDGTGTNALFSNPYGMSLTRDGNIIVMESAGTCRLRSITPTGVTTTIAGSGTCATVDGIGQGASFLDSLGVAASMTTGVVYVTSRAANIVRVVDTSGAVAQFAGSGTAGSVDGLGTSASFNCPFGVAVSPDGGTIYVTECIGNKLRAVTTGGLVSTVAGSGSAGSADGVGASASFNMPFGIAVAPTGYVFLVDFAQGLLRGVNPKSGAVTTVSSGFNQPTGVSLSQDPLKVFVVEEGSGKLSAVSIVTPITFSSCDSTWHHIALVYTPSASSLLGFCDGALIFAAAITVTLPIASSSTLRVGWSGDLSTNGGSLFSGSLADLRVYARALSPAEVSSFTTCTAGSTWSASGKVPCASCSTCPGAQQAIAAACTALSDTVCRCTTATYSYGSGACASCAAGASFVSAGAGCAPSATLPGPVDTAFYLSGSATEGAAALALTGTAPTFVADHTGAASGALALAGGAHLDVVGTGAPAALPSSGSVAFSASAWVQCAAPSTWAGVLEWGAAGDAAGAEAPQTLALAVMGTGTSPVWGVVSPLVVVPWIGGTLQPVNPGIAILPWATSTAVMSSTTQTSTVSGLAVVGNGGLDASSILAGCSYWLQQTQCTGSGFTDGLTTAAAPDHVSTARFNNPVGLATHTAANMIVVADTGNNAIRLVSYTAVTTLAGQVTAGSADGTGTAARFSSPQGVAVVPATGSVVVADTANNRLRLITYPAGVVSTVSNAFGSPVSFNSPRDVAVISSSSTIVVLDTSAGTVRLVSPSGSVSTLASGLSSPRGVAVLAGSSVVFAETGMQRVRLISPAGAVSTLATDAVFSSAVALAVFPTGAIAIVSSVGVNDQNGNHNGYQIVTPTLAIPACDSHWHHVALTYSPTAAPYTLSAFLDGALVAQLAATISLPAASASTLRVGWGGDLSVNGGSLFAGSLSDLRIYSRALSANEVASFIPCSSGAYSYGGLSCSSCAAGATWVSAAAGCTPSASLPGPADTAFYLSGSQAEGDTAFTSVAAPAGVSFVPDHLGAASGALALTSGSHLAATGSTSPPTLPSGGNLAWSASAWVKCAAPSTYASVLEWGGASGSVGSSSPHAIALDLMGASAAAVQGVATTLAVSGFQPSVASPIASSIAVTAEGNILAALGSVVASISSSTGAYSEIGRPSISGPCNIWSLSACGGSGISVIPSSGIIIVADPPGNAIYTVSAAGTAHLLAGSGSAGYADGVGAGAIFNNPLGVAYMTTSVAVADAGNYCIRIVSSEGVTSTLAGSPTTQNPGYADGTGTSAAFAAVIAIAYSVPGDLLFVIDQNMIRVVTSAGLVTTLAGNRQAPGPSNDGTGAAAFFYFPAGLTVLPSGTVAIADGTEACHAHRIVGSP